MGRDFVFQRRLRERERKLAVQKRAVEKLVFNNTCMTATWPLSAEERQALADLAAEGFDDSDSVGVPSDPAAGGV